MVICGSGSLTSSREEGIVVTNGNLTITGDAELDLTGNVRDTSIHVRYGTLTINGDADVKAKTISTNNADHQADVAVDAEISGNAKVSAEKLDIAGKLTMKGSSVVNVNGVGISGNQGIDILENAEVNVTSSSVALNAFYGPINIDSTKKVTAVTTSAAIAAGVSQATEPTNVTIKSEVEVSGSVGVAANGTNSNVVIDGGTVTANSSFIGLYTLKIIRCTFWRYSSLWLVDYLAVSADAYYADAVLGGQGKCDRRHDVNCVQPRQQLHQSADCDVPVIVRRQMIK